MKITIIYIKFNTLYIYIYGKYDVDLMYYMDTNNNHMIGQNILNIIIL